MTDLNIHGQKTMKAVTVTTEAIAISTSGTRIGLVIRNNDSANTVYLGRDATVTTSTGFPLKAGETLVDYDAYDRQFGNVDSWYAISAGSIDVRVIEYSG